MFRQDLAARVKAALVNLGLERCLAGDSFVILDSRAVRGDAGAHMFDPGHSGELLFNPLVVERGQHSFHIKSGCFHIVTPAPAAQGTAYTNDDRWGQTGSHHKFPVLHLPCPASRSAFRELQVRWHSVAPKGTA